MKNLVKQFQNTSYRYDLWKKGSRIILGISGGPDSCAMLDIFARLQKKYSLQLLIAHVNYGLRGKDSDADEKLVKELAKKYEIETKILRPAKTKTYSENSLRVVRYDFFEKLRLKNKFDAIAVAHNADDQVETFLMRVLRGSGTSGLSAMKPKNDRLIRPLLEIPRSEILDYLKENALSYRIDKTNLENDFLRNKIRNRLIPYLEKNFNPNLRKTVSNSLVAISEDAEFLEEETAKYLKKITELSIKKLEKLPPAIFRRVLRKKLENVKGDLKNIDASHIEEIKKIAKSTKNKSQIVEFIGLKIRRKGDKLEISRIK